MSTFNQPRRKNQQERPSYEPQSSKIIRLNPRHLRPNQPAADRVGAAAVFGFGHQIGADRDLHHQRG
jgi:hypothetical protein